MLKRFTLALLFAAPGALAQGLEILPPAPTQADTITLRFTAPFSCPRLLRIQHSPLVPNLIAVEVDQGTCMIPPRPSEGRVTLGRLPTGTWQVTINGDTSIFSPPPPPFAQATFVVGPYPNISPISEDLSGYWLTDNPGEGVTIVQSGERLFMLFVTYDGAGNQRWLVVSDAKRDLTPIQVDGPARFIGNAFETRGGSQGPAPFNGTLIPAGTAEIPIPTPAYDRATLILKPPAAPPRTIELRRFRF